MNYLPRGIQDQRIFEILQSVTTLLVSWSLTWWTRMRFWQSQPAATSIGCVTCARSGRTAIHWFETKIILAWSTHGATEFWDIIGCWARLGTSTRPTFNSKLSVQFEEKFLWFTGPYQESHWEFVNCLLLGSSRILVHENQQIPKTAQICWYHCA